MNLPTTTSILKNNQHVAIVRWERSGDAVVGNFFFTDDGGRTHKHLLRAGTTQPLGDKWFAFDECAAGAWAYLNVPGFDLTEADLHWATAWALEAAKHKHAVMKERI